MMIFLCFSSKDRYTIVESVLYHLKNYGLDTWYDYHTLILGDSKYEENIKNGVEKCKFVILIISPNFYDCECGNMELEVIKALHKLHQIHIFPILYNVKATDLPNQYSWVKDIIYNELTDNSPVLPTCNQIVCKMLQEEISEKNICTFKNTKTNNEYINLLLEAYNDVDENNLNAKLTILYSIFSYLHIICKNRIKLVHSKVITQLFKQTKLYLDISFKEIIIAELSISLMLKQGVDFIENMDN